VAALVPPNLLRTPVHAHVHAWARESMAHEWHYCSRLHARLHPAFQLRASHNHSLSLHTNTYTCSHTRGKPLCTPFACPAHLHNVCRHPGVQH
jgi:hypothetical protein